MSRWRSRLAWSAVACLVGGSWGACRQEAQGPSASDAAEVGHRGEADAARDAEGAESGDAAAKGDCRDWSELDPDTLPDLPQTPYTATFEQVWRTVLQKHYDPTMGCTDWPRLRQTYGAKLARAASAEAAYEVMNTLLDELEQSHFGVVPPDDRIVADPDRGRAKPPFSVRWIDDQLLVVESEARGVPAGSVIVAIDGQPVSELAAKADKQSSRPAEKAFKVRRAAGTALSCKPGDRKRIRVQPPGRKPTTERRVPCVSPEGQLVSLGNLQNIPTRVEHRMLTDEGIKVGYLGFNVWMLPMVDRVQSAVADLRAHGMQALVLDLRGNPGGVGPMSVPIGRLFLQRSGSLGTLEFREFTNEFNVQGDSAAFAGPIAVLVDEGTASTSEIFVAGMRDLERVQVVGAGRSAGAALPSLIEELPEGAILQYVVGDYHSPRGTEVEGVGIRPDLVVEERREDFIEGRDPVLEAAVKLLQRNS